MKNFGWKGYIPAAGTERHAYATIARTVPIPRVKYGWSAPQLDQGQTPQCGPYSFAELYWTTMRQNSLKPVLINPQELADAYAEATGEPFDGVYNRIMLQVAQQLYGFKAYHQVEMTVDEITNCLAEGYNFLVGFPVYQSFEDASNGIIPMPGAKGDEWLGGHDCTIQRYDLDKVVVYGQNHWADWGFEGHTFVGTCHFQMPLEYLTRLGSDAWTITLT